MPVRLQRRITLPAALAWLGWLALGQTAEPVDLARAEALARQYCITCHLFPKPDLLDKKTWTSQVMPRMAIRMGLSPESVNKHPEAEALWKSGRFTRQPLITKADGLTGLIDIFSGMGGVADWSAKFPVSAWQRSLLLGCIFTVPCCRATAAR